MGNIPAIGARRPYRAKQRSVSPRKVECGQVAGAMRPNLRRHEIRGDLLDGQRWGRFGVLMCGTSPGWLSA
jgi:hypothetical protein